MRILPSLTYPTIIIGVCSALAAQPVTSPRGFDTTEGGTSFSHFGGSRRFQQIDQTQAGAPLVINAVAWRRNGGYTSATSVRTFDMQIDMGLCSFGQISQRLDDNYLPGTRTTVVNQMAVSFPDWTAAAPTPAPFDFVVKLPQPHVYIGTAALVIDFSYGNNSSTGSLSIDREFPGSTSVPAGTLLGTGCTATGRSAAFAHSGSLWNAGNMPTAFGMRMRLGATNAPTGPVIGLLDVTNQNYSGLLCSTLYAGPLVTLPFTASATGSVDPVDFGFPYNANFIGATLYSQLAALDAGATPLPLVVSNGRQMTMSGTPLSGHRCSYAWLSLPSTTGAATHFIGGGVVLQLL